MNPRRDIANRPSGQQGFTLVELLVALAVTVVVVLGILMLFDFNNKLTRVQTNVADMQQSERIAQYDLVRMARMAGRGGLPVTAGTALPTGSGISVLNNTPDGTNLIAGDTSSPKILAGTDVLTLRGAFSTPIYEVAFANPSSFVLTGPGTPTAATATGGTVAICDQSPAGTTQDLSALTALIDLAAGGKTRKEALIVVSPIADTIYAIVALDPVNSTKTAATCPGGKGVTIAFVCDPADSLVAKYRVLYPAPAGASLSTSLTNVAYVGILEEHRFYVREDHAISGDATSELTPVLSRARFYPGTDLAYADDTSNLKQDIADGILDLQIAFGIDVNGDGQLSEDLVHPDTDEWQGNSAADTALTGGLKAIRISTLARTNRRDQEYVPTAAAPHLIAGVEDHVYSTTDINDPVNGYDAVNFKGSMARLYRRRVLQTVVNLRNLTQ